MFKIKFIEDIKKEMQEEREENELDWMISNSIECGYKGNGYITDKKLIYNTLYMNGVVKLIKPKRFLFFWKYESCITIKN